MNQILIVEDDTSIAELLELNLTVAGYQCDVAYDGAEALTKIQKQAYSLALLDIMLPELDGFELISPMKEHHIPVIYVSAKNDVYDRVKGLRLGAEDYLVKPFEMLELLVRIEKVLARTQPAPREFSFAGVTVREEEHLVLAHGQRIDLKPMEYALLLMFLRHPDIVLTREQLLRQVWGEDYFGETRTVDSHVAALRKKLGWAEQIVTVHRIGYKLDTKAPGIMKMNVIQMPKF